MNARQAQVRMVALEHHDQDWNVEQYLRWLADLEDADAEDVGRVVDEEVDRVFGLIEQHYGHVIASRGNVLVIGARTPLDSRVVATVAFQQGMTFAAAALGREPFTATVDRTLDGDQ